MVAASGSSWSKRASALSRVVLCIVFLNVPEPREALHVAGSPSALLHAVDGLGWFLRWVPISTGVATTAYRVYFTCALLALVGLYTRVALWGLAGSAFYLFAVRQLTGVVLHDMHLLWLVGLLACTRSASAWSVDSWFRRGRGAARRLFDDGDTFLFWARTLLGLVYFFPGLWKLRASGLDWAFSDNLRNQLWAKWFQHHVVPSVRLDAHPNLLHALGAGTIAFELCFVFLVHVGPRTRLALGIAGVMFHLAIERFMLIPFSSLWLCYVVLLGGKTRRIRWRSAVSFVGAIMTLLIALHGLQGKTQSYPFACYPTFQERAGATLPDMMLTIEDAQGNARELPVARDAGGYRTQTDWGEVWSVLGIYGAPVSEPRLRAFVLREVTRAGVRAKRARIEVAYFETNPARWGTLPVSRRQVFELTF